MNKKMYVMPSQQVVDLGLTNGVANDAGVLPASQGVDVMTVREERDWGMEEPSKGTHNNVWEQW